MKVAIVHDDLVQWGGAERVLLALSEVFPDAPIYTSVFDSKNKNLVKHFKDKKIVTSFMQKIPGWKIMYKALLPLYPIAFEQFDFSDFDLVISQTTRFAKSVITKPTTKHICYCHTPPRFLWNFSGEKHFSLLSAYLSFLRIYDQESSTRVDQFIAGSENAKRRIKKIYKRDSRVCYPFVDTDLYKEVKVFDGDYFLIVARLNFYKRVDLAVRVFTKLGLRLKVVGVGSRLEELKKEAGKTVEFLGSVSDEMLVDLLAGCRGLIVTAEEDFGLTPLEAQILGKGVIAYERGGALETVKENETGVFFKEQTAESLEEAVKRYGKLNLNPSKCRANAMLFSKENFKRNFLGLINSLS